MSSLQSPHGNFSYAQEVMVPTGVASTGEGEEYASAFQDPRCQKWTEVLQSNFMQRTASAVVLVPLVTVFLWHSPVFATTTVCSFATSVCCYEYSWLAYRIQLRILPLLEAPESGLQLHDGCASEERFQGISSGSAPVEADAAHATAEILHEHVMNNPITGLGDFEFCSALSVLVSRYFSGREWKTVLCVAGLVAVISSSVFLLAVQWVPQLHTTEFYALRWYFATLSGFIVGICAAKTPTWRYAVVVLIEYLIFVLLISHSAACSTSDGRCRLPLSRRRAFLGGMIVILVFRLISSRNGIGAIVSFMLDALGLVYIVGSLSVIVAFVDDSHRSEYRKLLIALLYVVWASDTGAYLFGKTLSYFNYPYYHPLAVHLSKNKDYEGTVGAIVFGVLAMAAASEILDLPGSFGAKVGYTIVAVIFGRVSDLFESLLKRAADVKDSGTLIPGHGGVLDRIDALMFATIVFSHYYRLSF